MTREKFGFVDNDVSLLIAAIIEKGLSLERMQSDEVFPDEDDAVFYEVCLKGRETKDAYLVTGNLKHYPLRSYVVTPREMLEIVENNALKMLD